MWTLESNLINFVVTDVNNDLYIYIYRERERERERENISYMNITLIPYDQINK